MRYCIQYYKDFRYNDLIDEIIFPYHDNIVDIISQKKWKDEQRFIIDVSAEGDLTEIIPAILMCKKVHDNLSVLLTLKQSAFIAELRKANISFFYFEYARTLDQIYGLIYLGTSDIYVTESAGFNLKEIGEYCHHKNVNVRVIPNMAQYTPGFRNSIPDPCKFFIRPEDTHLYEEYVDVFELIAPKEKTSVLYEIYKNKVWEGDLDKIITGFSDIVKNTTLIPYFGSARLSCQQKCMLGKCNHCIMMKEMGERFKDSKVTFKIPKDKEWNNERYKIQSGTDEETMQHAEVESSSDVNEDTQD